MIREARMAGYWWRHSSRRGRWARWC